VLLVLVMLVLVLLLLLLSNVICNVVALTTVVKYYRVRLINKLLSYPGRLRAPLRGCMCMCAQATSASSVA
jgi:hypothetical protein